MDFTTASPLLSTDAAGVAELGFLSRCIEDEQRTFEEQIRLCLVMLELSDFLFQHRFDGVTSRVEMRFIIQEGKEVIETDCHQFYLLHQVNKLAEMCIFTKLRDELNLTETISITSLSESSCVSAAKTIDRVIGILRHCIIEVINKRCYWAKILMESTCQQIENRYYMLRALGLWLTGGFIAAVSPSDASADLLQIAGNRLFTCQQLIQLKLSQYSLAKGTLADCLRLQAVTSAQWNVKQANLGAAVAFFKQAKSLGHPSSPSMDSLMHQNETLGQPEPTLDQLSKTPPVFAEDKGAVTGARFTIKQRFRPQCEEL